MPDSPRCPRLLKVGACRLSVKRKPLFADARGNHLFDRDVGAALEVALVDDFLENRLALRHCEEFVVVRTKKDRLVRANKRQKAAAVTRLQFKLHAHDLSLKLITFTSSYKKKIIERLINKKFIHKKRGFFEKNKKK